MCDEGERSSRRRGNRRKWNCKGVVGLHANEILSFCPNVKLAQSCIPTGFC